MTASELIDAINLAADKNSLESLLAEAKPEIQIDKRKGLATIKTDVINQLQGQTDNIRQLPQSGDDKIVLPEIDDGEVFQEEKVVEQRNRIVVNTVNGRLLMWTPILAKTAGFKEVE